MPLNSLNNSTRIDRPSTPTTGTGHAGATPPTPTGTASQQATGSATLQRLGAVRRQSRQGKTSGPGQTQARGEAHEASSAAGDHAQLSMTSSMAALLAGSESTEGAEDKTAATPAPPKQEAESKTATQAETTPESAPDAADSAPATPPRPASAASASSPAASQSAAPPPPPASSRPSGAPPLPARPRPQGAPGTPPPVPHATRPQGAPPPIPHATRPQTAPPPIPHATRPQTAPPPIPHATRPQTAPPPIPHATRPQGAPPLPARPRPPGTPPAGAQRPPRPENDLNALLQSDLAPVGDAPPAYTALPEDPVQNAHLWAGQLNVMADFVPDKAAHIDDLLQLMGSRPVSEGNAGRVSLPDLPPAERAAVAEQAVQTLCKAIASMPPGTLKARDVHGAIAAAQHVVPLAQRAVLLGDLAKMLNKTDSRGAHQSAFRAISDQVHLLPPQDRMQVLNGLALNAFHSDFADAPGAGQDAAANMRAVMNHLAHVPPEMRTPHETAVVLDVMTGWMPDMMANNPPSHWQPLMHELMQEAGKLPPEEGAFVTDTLGKAMNMMQPGGPLHGVDLQALLLVVPDHLKPGHRDDD